MTAQRTGKLVAQIWATNRSFIESTKTNGVWRRQNPGKQRYKGAVNSLPIDPSRYLIARAFLMAGNLSALARAEALKHS
jgi:hypothetical protein